jgi:hypothetical protein
VSECDREARMMKRPWPTEGCYTMRGRIMQHLFPEPKSKYAPKREYYSHYHYFYPHGYCAIWRIFPSMKFLLVWYKTVRCSISVMGYDVLIINKYILSSHEI